MKRSAAAVGFSLCVFLLVFNITEKFLFNLIITIFFVNAGAVCFFFKKTRFVFPVGISVLAAFAGFYIAYNLEFAPDTRYYGSELQIAGVVAELPDTNSCLLEITQCSLDGKPVKIKGQIRAYGIGVAQVKEYETVTGVIKISGQKEGGLFGGYKGDRAKGIVLSGRMSAENIEIQKSKGVKPLYYYAIQVRKFMAGGIESKISGEEGVLTKAVVLGDKSGLDADVRDNFSISGLSHIASVSGLHLSILVGFIFFLCGILRLGRKVRCLLCILAAAALCAVVGFSPSVSRAALMTVIMYGGMLFFKESDSLNSLGVASIILLVINPFSVCDLSFILSFSATLGVILIQPLSKAIKKKLPFVKENFSKEENKLKKLYKKVVFSITDVAMMSLAAAIFTFPVTAYVFAYTPVFGILANIAAMPAVSLLFLCGILTALLSPVGFLGLIPAYLGKLAASYLLWLTKSVAELPFSSFYSNKWFFYILASGFILIIFLFFIKKFKLGSFVTAAALLLTFAFYSAGAESYMNRGILKITVIDAGGGECTAVVKDGKAFLIDVGGNFYSYNKAINALGGAKLEAFVLSHYHKECFSNAEKILKKLKPGKIILPFYGSEEKYEAQFNEIAESISAEIIYAQTDINLILLKDISVNILTAHIDKQSSLSSKNSASAIVSIIYGGTRFVSMGGFDGQVIRLPLVYSELRADILKIGNHGSGNSVSEDFLKRLGVKAAVISVSNSEPAAGVVDILNKQSVKLYRTDEDGTITITSDGKKLKLTAESVFI